MFTFSQAVEPLVSAFSIAFSRQTFQRVVVLILAAILSFRRRTITAMLEVVGPLARGHWSDFHRVLSRASWSTWTLGKVLAGLILDRVPAGQPVVIPVEDTAGQHTGFLAFADRRHCLPLSSPARIARRRLGWRRAGVLLCEVGVLLLREPATTAGALVRLGVLAFVFEAGLPTRQRLLQAAFVENPRLRVLTGVDSALFGDSCPPIWNHWRGRRRGRVSWELVVGHEPSS